MIWLLVLATVVVAFEVGWQISYFGPERWRRWAWLKSHRLTRLAAAERERIYRERGLSSPEKT